MKVHMFGYNLSHPKMSKSKIHILTISEPISMKPAIVYKKEEQARAKLLRLLLCLSLRLPLNCRLQVKSKQPKDLLILV